MMPHGRMGDAACAVRVSQAVLLMCVRAGVRFLLKNYTYKPNQDPLTCDLGEVVEEGAMEVEEIDQVNDEAPLLSDAAQELLWRVGGGRNRNPTIRQENAIGRAMWGGKWRVNQHTRHEEEPEEKTKLNHIVYFYTGATTHARGSASMTTASSSASASGLKPTPGREGRAPDWWAGRCSNTHRT